MAVQVSVQIKPSHRQSVLASATVTLQTEDSKIEIHDCRVMRNRQGIVWAALPSFSITSGKQYEYLPSVVLNPALHRNVSDSIVASYEKWAARQSQQSGEVGYGK